MLLAVFMDIIPEASFVLAPWHLLCLSLAPPRAETETKACVQAVYLACDLEGPEEGTRKCKTGKKEKLLQGYSIKLFTPVGNWGLIPSGPAEEYIDSVRTVY